MKYQRQDTRNNLNRGEGDRAASIQPRVNEEYVLDRILVHRLATYAPTGS